MTPAPARSTAWPSRIAVRLLAFNLLLLFLPVAGILYLDVYETRLLEAEERSMVQQGRLVAAALSERAAIEPAAVYEFLSGVGQRGDARLRVYGADATLIADSNRIRFPGEAPASSARSSYPETTKGVRARALYRAGAWLAAARRKLAEWTSRFLVRRRQPPPQEVPDEGVPPEVSVALTGRYGSATRPTPGQRSLTLYSAVPIRRGSEIVGAVQVSETTFRVLQALYDVRLRIFEVVVASFFAAALLTVVAAATVVRPLVRLRRNASDLAERRGGLPARFEDAGRGDEIGDLARALEELTRRLDEHVRAVEQFAGDVSHEFRNGLAAIRSAAEMAIEAETAGERARFLELLTRDVDRLERLVSGVRELARIDAQLEQQPLQAVDVGSLLQQVVEGLRLADPDRPAVVVHMDGRPAIVRASSDRLAQVFENVIANARSFAPPGTLVEVSVETGPSDCSISISDRGPGIPSAHLDRVFERFFSYRPHEPAQARIHTGLGLAIARTIVRGFGGTITAANRSDGGARFEIRIPAGD